MSVRKEKFRTQAHKDETIKKLQHYFDVSEAITKKSESIYHDHLERLRIDRENLEAAKNAPIEGES